MELSRILGTGLLDRGEAPCADNSVPVDNQAFEGAQGFVGY